MTHLATPSGMPDLPAPRTVTELPFVRSTERGNHFWSVDPTGDYEQDVATGRHYARAALACSQAVGDPCLLLWILRAMPIRHKRKKSGIEIGFLAALSGVAI